MTDDDDPLAFIGRVVREAGAPACLIGGHAVNVFAEPRFTADIDRTGWGGSWEPRTLLS